MDKLYNTCLYKLKNIKNEINDIYNRQSDNNNNMINNYKITMLSKINNLLDVLESDIDNTQLQLHLQMDYSSGNLAYDLNSDELKNKFENLMINKKVYDHFAPQVLLYQMLLKQNLHDSSCDEHISRNEHTLCDEHTLCNEHTLCDEQIISE